MFRIFAIVVLAAGAVLGFGAGFAHLCGYGPHGYFGHGPYGHGFGPDSGRFEDHTAEVCVRAAERVLAERQGKAPAAPPAAPPSAP